VRYEIQRISVTDETQTKKRETFDFHGLLSFLDGTSRNQDADEVIRRTNSLSYLQFVQTSCGQTI
jgi:hypothetical protein